MAKQITAESIATKWDGAAKNHLRMERDLVSLEQLGYDTAEALDNLEEYRTLERGDFDDAEEYAEAREEAWTAILDSIEAIEEIDNTDSDEETIVTTKTAPKTAAKTTAAKTTATKTAPKATQAKHAASNSAIAKVAAKVTRTKAASKVCRVCGLTKPLTDFRVKASRPDGRDTICAEDARLWLANRKAIVAKQAKPVAKPKATAKAAPKAAAKPATKPVAKTAAKPVLPAREAAARAKDAQARVATSAK